MTIYIITVGKIKEKFYASAISAYVDKIGLKHDIHLVEVSDEKAPETLSDKEALQIKGKEGARILDKIPDRSHVIALAIDGKPVTKPWSQTFEKRFNSLGKEALVFVIGGSLGLSNDVLKRSNEQISFGKATFPHQLMKVILLAYVAS